MGDVVFQCNYFKILTDAVLVVDEMNFSNIQPLFFIKFLFLKQNTQMVSFQLS